ncbi:WSC-domain-containing protein, partial [Corynespora cassiicola Philippines]
MLKRTLPASFPSNGWSYIGCYLDNVSQRVLSEASCFDDKAMTGEACVDFCGEQGYTIAGVGYGRECYCGFEFLLKTTAKAADCNMACSGDSAQACGGPNRLSAFTNGAPGPVANLGVNSFVFKGCWSDSVQARTLSHTVRTQGDSGGLSIAACTSACKGQGFIYSGVEYGRECWCGAALNSIAQSIPGGPVISGCDFVCTGNASEFCGGANRLSLYQFDDRI